MKEKLINFLEILIVLILIIAVLFIGYMIYDTFFDEGVDTGIPGVGYPDIDYSQIDKKDKKDDDENIKIDLSENESTNNEQEVKIENKQLYSQLNKEAKIIYEKLYQNKNNLKTGTYTINFGTGFNYLFTQNDEDTAYDILTISYQAAIEAFIYENPDVFYLDVTKMYINFEKKTQLFKTQYNIYINNYGSDNYLAEGFNSKEEIDECEAKIELLRDAILEKINGKSDLEKLRYIHNYLVDNIDYETTISKPNIYNIYGALILKECVCEGYAKAFQYLVSAAGFENVIINGKATNTTGETENHAWNYVKIDNAWYAVDTTWDDPIIIGGGKLTESNRYQYFLKGSTTMDRNHTSSKKFTEDSMEFEHPTLSITDYKY